MKAFWIFATVVLLVWIIAWLHRRATLFHAFAQLAQRYRGRAFNSWGTVPSATFSFRGSTVQLSSNLRLPSGGGRQTRLSLAWPDRRFQLVLWTRKSRFRRPILTGLVPFAFPQADLNSQFEAWTSDTALAESLVTPASTWQLLKLVELAAHDHVYWSIRRGRMHVYWGGHYRNVHKLCDGVETALNLFAQAALTQQKGLSFVDDQEARVIEEMICPICSGVITNDVVICVRCRTPHCKECWQYNGKCATFACGAEKYVTTPSLAKGSGRQ